MSSPVKYIDASKITVKFGGKYSPKDEKFISLYKKALTGKLKCTLAVINIKGIKQFSDYQPKISKDFKDYFTKRIEKKDYPKIHVYPEGDHFIMSDDYSSYYLYLNQGFNQILCLVMGKATGEHVHTKSKPFKLTIPKEISADKE